MNERVIAPLQFGNLRFPVAQCQSCDVANALESGHPIT
jgi:hypothetical protein